MKMYKASFSEITEVEVLKASDTSVWINNDKVVRKFTSLESYFNTWEGAKEHLLAEAKTKINTAKTHLEYEQKKYEKIQALHQ